MWNHLFNYEEGQTTHGWFLSQNWDKWSKEENGRFTVQSAYKILEVLLLPEEIGGGSESNVFASVWKSLAPPKVMAFS